MDKQEKCDWQDKIYSVLEWLAAKKNNALRPQGVTEILISCFILHGQQPGGHASPLMFTSLFGLHH
ncbi:TPA: hypothetical protein U2I12_002347 [Citrobacter farmeri]|nr:hypothetical protein [Citrobacter farmeri]